MTATQALEAANKEMDAIYVDANDSAAYLPDLLNNAVDADYDETPVIVETDGKGKLVLTRMEDGYRAGHYGTILDVDHREASRY